MQYIQILDVSYVMYCLLYHVVNIMSFDHASECVNKNLLRNGTKQKIKASDHA